MLRITFGPQRPAVVDRKSLEIVGIVYGALTAAVVMIAAVLVYAHVDGRLALNDASHQAGALPSARVVP